MTSEIRVNKINNRAGLGTITIADTGVVVNGIVTCTEVSGLNVLNIAGVSTFASPLDINGDIDVDGHTELDNVRIAGVATFYQGGSEVVRINSGGLLLYNDLSFFGASTHAYWDHSANQFKLNDNTKLSVGSSSDLQIFHDGTNSSIKNTTGDLYIDDAGGNIYIQAKTGEQSIVAFADGAVDLYYDNSKKLETVTGGVSVTGDMTASGNVTAYSDAKLKTEIHTINDALGIVGKLRGVNYKWLSNGQSDIGVIAQEVEEVIPEVVKETEDGTKTVDYSRIVSVLINAVNELKAEVEELKGGK